MLTQEIKTVLHEFALQGEPCGCEEIKVGHINRTYKITVRNMDGSEQAYILQWINSTVFPKTPEVMSNIVRVTSHIKEKLREAGKDEHTGTLTVIPLRTGEFYYTDEDNNKWRMFEFIPDAITYMVCESPDMFRSVGYAFGEFQRQLADFDASTLYETIEDFHNTPKRFDNFEKAVAADVCGRAGEVASEIRFIRERKDRYSVITDALASGRIPLRVTHNDTKLNNVMIDPKTGQAVCVVDLDTVMPGSSLYDFGDAIRFGASSADEDETDLSKVFVRTDLYEAFTEGFCEALEGALTDEEIRMFPDGAWMMTVEVGMRFLTDYLSGDTYFRIGYPKHNLDRARNQLKLVSDMEAKEAELRRITESFIPKP